MAVTKRVLKDILISDYVVTDADDGALSNYLPLSGGTMFGDLVISAANFKQTTGGEVYNFSGKNSFLQAEEAFSGSTGESYGIACTGSRGYCILSIIADQNALKLSGNISMLSADNNMLCSYSIAFWQQAATEIGTITDM